jgi:adenylate cyclase
VEPELERYAGRIVKFTGDGFLAEFPTVQGAVECAIAMQNGLRKNPLSFRIGVNFGDVIDDGDDIHGEGVNIAARIEALAEPGGICVSAAVLEQVRNKVNVDFSDYGSHTVKHVSSPIHVWRWSVEASDPSSRRQEEARKTDNPGIAVLPFVGLSNDPEQQYFADGIAEDLIAALSRFSWLIVVARNSSFSLRDKDGLAQGVAASLGVRYVLEGSVRSSPRRIRVSVQLVDAEKDRHIWAEKYDRPTGDVFDLQDEIVQSITGVIVPALGAAERERSVRTFRPTITAWQAYQKGLHHYYKPFTHDDQTEARAQFAHAVDIDPNFADAHAMNALLAVYAFRSGLSTFIAPYDQVMAAALQSAQASVALDDRNAIAHIALGLVNDRLGNTAVAVVECGEAIRLNPNLAIAHHELGFVLNHAGRPSEAIPWFAEAIRLSPNDPSRWNFFLLKGMCEFGVGDFAESLPSLNEASRLRPSAHWPFLGLAATYAAMGDHAGARMAVAEALVRKPECSLGFVRAAFGAARADHLDRTLDALRDAGLPA